MATGQTGGHGFFLDRPRDRAGLWYFVWAMWCSVPRRTVALPGVLLVTLAVLPWFFAGTEQEPNLPLEEIVQRFAQKESEYAGAHSGYEYQLTVRVQELDETGSVIGEFEQEGTVGFDARGRRSLRLSGNPRSDLIHLGIQRIQLEDLSRLPLFLLRPEEIEKYDFTYLTRERVDEIDTYLFRMRPKGVPRITENLFEGVVWVDASQLDIVRAQGRLVPAHTDGPLGRYFQRMEIYRQPVDEFLFTTFVRSDDIIRAVGGEGTVRARLIVRFSGHKRIRPAESGPEASRENR